jgi:hypothetical protein
MYEDPDIMRPRTKTPPLDLRDGSKKGISCEIWDSPPATIHVVGDPASRNSYRSYEGLDYHAHILIIPGPTS